MDGSAAGGARRHRWLGDRRVDRRGATGGLPVQCHLRVVNEIGFDVLRDQLVTDVGDLVLPNPDVALIDEADSVLVDEALVPLVLAGPATASSRGWRSSGWSGS